jgi:hypothetical protein
MKKYLFLLAVIIGFVTPLPDEGLSVVTVEGDTITGNTLPRYGILCEDADVQGNPYDGFKVYYTIPKGKTVRLREQGGDNRSWVMIAPAYWIRGNTICGW